MNSLSNIVRQRSAPGVLVVDAAGRMLFANERALDLLATLRGPEDGTEALPESIRDLCLHITAARPLALSRDRLSADIGRQTSGRPAADGVLRLPPHSVSRFYAPWRGLLSSGG